ncbi:hypothetical protein ABIB25_005759 [Nakamurella sp. UYEF19]|uniref:hypothetical protein n=1 Tax=Nakamurella sp. UYEF19 TaxID=1756392 RepID=UPI0033912A65
MFTPDRAAAAIAIHNKRRNKHFASLDDVAGDLGMGTRPRIGALAWADGIIEAVGARAAAATSPVSRIS